MLSLDVDQADCVGYGVSRLLSTHSFCQESPLSGQLEPCFRRACHQDVGWFENTTPTFRPDYAFLFSANLVAVFEPFISPLDCIALSSRNGEEIMQRGLQRVIRCNIPSPSVKSGLSLLSTHAAYANKDDQSGKEKRKGKSIDIVVKCRDW
jgi:hypothetical protein